VGRNLEGPFPGYNLGGAACTLVLQQDQIELAAEEEVRHIRLGVEVRHTAVPGEAGLVVRPENHVSLMFMFVSNVAVLLALRNGKI
jgi:hypothetical protein